MSTAPLANGRRGQPLEPPTGGVTPHALDFTQVLYRCQQREDETARYLLDLQAQVAGALEQLGYQDIDVHLADQPRPSPDIAAAGRLSVVTRLPGAELRRADFSLTLPVSITYGGEIRIRNAEINGFLAKETFIHPLDAEPAQVARVVTHGLSQLYMLHLLKAGGCAALSCPPSLRRGSGSGDGR